tara:strand:- start:408 stop:764 length:357 start_codon:yes stop_codon:yes gene_type:complete
MIEPYRLKIFTVSSGGIPDVSAAGVHDAEVVLGRCITLLGGLVITLDRFGVVLGNAQALIVHDGDVVLGLCTLLGKRHEFLECRGVITSLSRCYAIIEICPRRPSAKEKRDDDSECGG